MPGVFISYRRDDTAGLAGRLYKTLEHHFGTGSVFLDADNKVIRSWPPFG